ncbi:MAG TPA: hypothetical protein VFG20_11640 [Planctomycetaceae bacterium]|nr:hypothetical protein [Planctomycetaceae bacterium]
MTSADPVPPLDVRPILRVVMSDHRVRWNGIHGAAHWGRVLQNGLWLSASNNADAAVVTLFAVLHDSRRVNDHWDPGHGRRGAELARQLRGDLFELTDSQFGQLYHACEHHTAGHTEGDLTVRTCWDSDRLDLGRVGIWPDPRKLCTDHAREKSVIAWALERSQQGTVPPFVTNEWATAVSVADD